MYIKTMLAALVGAIIGAIAVIGSVYFGHWLSQRSEHERWEREMNRKRRDFASTLALEVEGALARLNTALKADHYEPPALIKESYFTVFDANTAVLTLLDETDAQNALNFYLAAKRQFDALRELRELWQHSTLVGGPVAATRVEALYKDIQQSQQEVARMAAFALKSLKKY